MMIIDLVSSVIQYVTIGATIGVILLVVARVIVNYADLNPFSRTALNVRQFSDPLVNPVRRFLISYGLDQKIAPFVTILIAILIGFLLVQMFAAVFFTVRGVLSSLQRGDIRSLMGHILVAGLTAYSLLIVARIVFSWGMSYGNRTMRFLVRVTEPVLGPFRRLIPPLGMFDISPMIVLLVLHLFQRFIAGALIS